MALSCAPLPPATSAQRPAPAPVVAPAAPETPAPAQTYPVTPPEGELGIVAPPLATAPRRPPFIALLLPLDAADFRAPAEAFVRGFETAAQQRALPVPVEVHATDASPERIHEAYARVLQEGAAVVVGPMTRNGVSTIAGSGLVMVPTLSLNQPDANVTLPPNLYAFGLATESEARIVAQQAFRQGLRRMAVVGTPSAFSRRVADAFVHAWQTQGGTATVVLEVPPDSDLTQMRTMLAQRSPDGVFLAAAHQDARMIRPYLPSQMPVYATSQINVLPPDPVGTVDLNGVRFIDMPWLLTPEDPLNSAFADYPRPEGMQGDLLRFYALGVDAEFIAAKLAEGSRRIDFDGLTGHVSVQPDGTVERLPWPATFQAGAAMPLQ